MIDALWAGLSLLLEPATLALMFLGVLIGFAVGVLPGLGGAVTLALMLPFTFDMEPAQVFAFLLGMYVVTATTGDITSVLFGIPGEATSVVAMLDGYPLSRQGQAGRALGAVLTSSFLGTMFGAAALAASLPIIRPLTLQLGTPEFFALTLLGLTFVITLSGKSVLRGLLMAAAGFVVGMIGLDNSSGIPRYTFGQLELWDGVGIVPIVVGLFGGAEVLQLMLSKRSVAQPQNNLPSKVTGVMDGVRDAARHWWLAVRCSGIGVGIGVIPGMGGSVGQFIAYGHAQTTSRSAQTFGKGNIEGVVAAGSNNNANASGSLIPTIAFGIPGSVATAVLLGGFLIAGLNPGPEMLTTELPVTMLMVWVMVLANVLAVGLAFLLLNPLARLTFIRGTLLVPFLLVLLSVGAFTSSNSYFDVYIMLGAAAVGVLAIRWEWPRVPFLLALVLGGIAENYLYLSHSLFGWGWLSNPIVMILFVISGSVIAGPFMTSIRARRRLRAGARTADGTSRDEATVNASQGLVDPALTREGGAGVATRGFTSAGPEGAVPAQRKLSVGRFVSADFIFAAILLTVFVAVFIGARDWPPSARMFPTIVSSTGIVLALAKMGLSLRSARKSHVQDTEPLDGDEGDGEQLEYVFAQSSKSEWARVLGWVSGFFLALVLVGAIPSILAFTVLYLRAEARTSWVVACSYGAVLGGLLIATEEFLRIFLPPGLIF